MNQDIGTRPSVDFLMLADRAEALNGKLYVMGGAWDRLYVPDFSVAQAMSIAIGIIVPWSATHTGHALVIRVEGPDAEEIATIRLDFTTGTSPLMQPGQSQRIVLGLPAAIKLPGPGTYEVKALIDDTLGKSVELYAELRRGPGVMTKQPPAANR